MKRENTCFFTGHRIISNETKEMLRNVMYEKVEELIKTGVTDFIAGGAIGFDMLCERVVIELREKYKNIRLILYLPCYNNMERWSINQKYYGRLMMAAADEVIYTTESKYVSGCMQHRNKRMAEDAKYCIAYCTNLRSGTGVAISYAKDYGDIIYNLAN